LRFGRGKELKEVKLEHASILIKGNVPSRRIDYENDQNRLRGILLVIVKRLPELDLVYIKLGQVYGGFVELESVA
jgi:hypothetical protein